MLKVDQPAPDFETVLDDGSPFRLSDLRGDKNVVLYFYPADFTGGCTAQACSFRDNYDAVKAFDAVIVGVSGDSSESHRSFREKHSLGFPLIADEDRRIADLYEVKSSLPMLRPRVTYVIDKQGVIRAAFRHDLAIGRHLVDTLVALEKLEASRSR
ncbi:MAG: peroxiredoxin [Dehalococcoidia bacterium]